MHASPNPGRGGNGGGGGERNNKDASVSSSFVQLTVSELGVVEVQKGQYVTIHGNEGAMQAVRDGRAIVMQCAVCAARYQVEPELNLLYCTQCESVTPQEIATNVPATTEDEDFLIAMQLQQIESSIADEEARDYQKPGAFRTWGEMDDDQERLYIEAVRFKQRAQLEASSKTKHQVKKVQIDEVPRTDDQKKKAVDNVKGLQISGIHKLKQLSENRKRAKKKRGKEEVKQAERAVHHYEGSSSEVSSSASAELDDYQLALKLQAEDSFGEESSHSKVEGNSGDHALVQDDYLYALKLLADEEGSLDSKREGSISSHSEDYQYALKLFAEEESSRQIQNCSESSPSHSDGDYQLALRLSGVQGCSLLRRLSKGSSHSNEDWKLTTRLADVQESGGSKSGSSSQHSHKEEDDYQLALRLQASFNLDVPTFVPQAEMSDDERLARILQEEEKMAESPYRGNPSPENTNEENAEET